MEEKEANVVTPHAKVGNTIVGIGNAHVVLTNVATGPDPFNDDLYIKTHTFGPNALNDLEESFKRVDAATAEGIFTFESRFETKEKAGNFSPLFA
jgi:hypothetical protein